jgi:peptidoglycan hydrolase-like protein with peptidoglycan-binding domain
MKKIFAPLVAALVVTAAASGAVAQSEGQGSVDKSAKQPQTPATQGKVPNIDSSTGQGTVPGVTPSSPYASPPPATGPSATSPSVTAPSTAAGAGGTENKEVIREVQMQLQAAGFSPGATNGIMDDQTRNAIRQFQQAKGLNATGELDQETRSALLSGAAAGTAPGSNR